MPKHRLLFVIGAESIMTPGGPLTHLQTITGYAKDREHLNSILVEWHTTRGLIEIPASKEELAAGQGVMSSTTYIDLSKVLSIIVREETDLTITTAPIDISNKGGRFQ